MTPAERILRDAIRADDAGGVREAIRLGASPETFIQDAPEETGPLEARAIHHAAARGATRALSALIEAGADVNSVEMRDQWGALHFASFHGHPEAVAVLLAAGADPDARDRGDRPPISVAIPAGRTTASALSRKEDSARIVRLLRGAMN